MEREQGDGREKGNMNKAGKTRGGAARKAGEAGRRSLLAVLACLALAALACGPLASLYPPNISGAWHGEYQDDPVTMDFDTSGDVWLYAGNNEPLHGAYEVNFDVEPHHLDIAFDNGDQIETIFEFIDRNHIRMENNEPGGARPTEFADYIELAQ